VQWRLLKLNWAYGVGELVIVDAGVMIALSAESWLTERQDRIDEIELLEAIKEDVRETAVRSDNNLARVNLRLESLRLFNEGNAALAGLDDESLADMLSSGLWENGALSVQMSAYEEIKSSGRLGLIEDPQLRRALSQLDRHLQRVRAREVEAFEHQMRVTGPYVMSNIQVAQLDRSFQDWDTWVPLKVTEVRDHRSLLDTPDFQNQVAARYLLMFGLAGPSYRFARGLAELETLIDARLATLRR
jgi:hypothetical protein